MFNANKKIRYNVPILECNCMMGHAINEFPGVRKDPIIIHLLG